MSTTSAANWLQPGPRTGSSSLRWLLLVPFIWGVLERSSVLAHVGWSVPLLNAAAGLSLALLLMRLDRPARDVLWIWIILAVFLVGYFYKTYLFASRVGQESFDIHLAEQLKIVAALPLMISAYGWATLAFATFCLAAALAVGRREAAHPEGLELNLSRARALLVLLVVLSVALIFVRAILGIGQMGVAGGQRLPFRVDTLIFRLQGDSVPSLLVLCAWVFDRERTRRWWALAIGAIVLHQVGTSIVIVSKSGVITAALTILFLWLLSGKLSARRLLPVIATIAVGVFLFFPLLSWVRWARDANQITLAQAGSVALQYFLDNSPAAAIQSAVDTVTLRIVGADGIWFALNDQPKAFSFERIREILGQQSLAVYYTERVFRELTPGTFRVPGLIGAFVLFGGAGTVMVLTAAYILAVGLLWRLLGRLTAAPVTRTVAALFVFSLSVEGTFQVQAMVALVFNLALIWIVAKLLLERRRTEEDLEVPVAD